MSVHRPAIKSDILVAATRRMIELMYFHSVIGLWIIVVQCLLRLLAPLACVFLMNVNLLVLAERSWKVQARSMLIWHPVVQLFFCVSRLLHGVAVFFSVMIWARLLVMGAARGRVFE